MLRRSASQWRSTLCRATWLLRSAKRSRPTSLVRKSLVYVGLPARARKISLTFLRGELAVMSKVETILEEIKGLTLLEASDLVKKMEEAFGVSAAAARFVAAGGGGALRLRLLRKRRRNSPLFSLTLAVTRSTSL